MEPNRFSDGSSLFSSPNGGAASSRRSPPPRQPNYTCAKVQEALEHLASIDPIDLCNEAKLEHCRATRDLRNCGRNVQSALNSCGHASLCEECSQRCDVCPICKIPLSKDGSKLRLRLYYECIEASLISKRCDDRLQDKEEGEKELIADVQRLCALFDVALENNLSALICHYVTYVCMDESAVSSDPVTAFLLDEVVVKDWCKRTFQSILEELQKIYNYTVLEMEECLTSLLKYSAKLAGLANVVEVLESSFKGSLDRLQDSIVKTKQHMEVMTWCIRHQFLELVESRHADIASWRAAFRERKNAAIRRAWPDSVTSHATEPHQVDSATLFVEDALSNIDAEQEHVDNNGEELQIAYLQKGQISSFLRSKIEGLAGCYPFENLRAAIDLLFLQGSSDLVVSKQAILLYYLFDRHWTMPEEIWKDIVNDFAATFSITRHSLLESFVFYLLDDHTDEALREACRLLPEISSPTIHPKVARVLLERQNPDAALMVLRWSGRDDARLVSLEEALTTVRVRVECGLLTEAFMYQRAVCMKIKDKNLKDESFHNVSRDVTEECCPWGMWVEALVTEICCLCIRRNLVDRMIELPWISEEEKHIHKCLIDFSADDPSSIMGSLLVVFYLQRYRYTEAFEVDRKLHSMEQEFISKKSASDQVLMRMRSMSDWRAGLVDKSVELLPDVIQKQLKDGKFPEVVALSAKEVVGSESFYLAKAGEPVLNSLLVPSISSPLASGKANGMSSSKPSVFDTLSKASEPVSVYSSAFQNYGGSTPPSKWFSDLEKGQRHGSGLSRNFNFNSIPSKTHRAGSSTPSPMRQLNSSSRQTSQTIHLPNGSTKKFPSPSPHRSAANPLTPLRNNQAISQDFAHNSGPRSKLLVQEMDTISSMPVSGDPMDMLWSHGKRALTSEETNTNSVPRWRSDDDSDDEEQQSLNRVAGASPYTRSTRGVRRSRLMR